MHFFCAFLCDLLEEVIMKYIFSGLVPVIGAMKDMTKIPRKGASSALEVEVVVEVHLLKGEVVDEVATRNLENDQLVIESSVMKQKDHTCLTVVFILFIHLKIRTELHG